MMSVVTFMVMADEYIDPQTNVSISRAEATSLSRLSHSLKLYK